MPIKLLWPMLPMLLAGCANFTAVSEFAQQTTKVTGSVRTEFAQLESLCKDQAELTIVVDNIPDDGPLDTCTGYSRSEGRLAAVTLDVLDDYAKALSGLANDKSFDLTTDLDAVGAKVAALTKTGGAAIVNASEVAALTTIAEVLADVATLHARDRAVQRLVDEAPDLATTGRILRSFFVADPQAPIGRSAAPYATIVGLTRDSFNSAQHALQSARFHEAEPLRTAELLRGMRARDAQLRQRSIDAADSIPAALVAALDAWLAAVDRFAQEALKPDPQELLKRLKDLRDKANAARDALQQARS